jgi:UDP-glucose 4-epimerase
LKTLVFGGKGYIGGYLVQALRAGGHQVIVESTGDPRPALDPTTGKVRDDYQPPQGLDAVFYLSQSPWYKDLPERIDHVLAVNCLAAHRLARLCAEAGARRFVYASTGTVYVPSFAPLAEDAALRCDDLYALSKIAGERVLAGMNSGMRTCCARLFGVYGPGQQGKMTANLCNRLLRREPVTLAYDPGSDEQSGIRLSMTHVEDVAQGLIALAELDQPPTVVNLAGPGGPSIRELVQILAEEMELEPIFQPLETQVQGHFLADASLLHRTVNLRFQPLREGLRGCVQALG